MAAQDEVGVLVAELEVFGRQMAKALGGRTEQQGDRAGSPDVRRQDIVSQTSLEEWPSVVLIEQVLGLCLGIEGTVSSPVSRRLVVHFRKYRIR